MPFEDPHAESAMSTVRRLNCSSLRFLIVDPDGFYRAILRSVFWGFGATTILEAETPEDALDIFRHHDIDLITTEWARPETPELIRTIRRSQTRNFMLPIFVVTCETTRRNVFEARDAGANEVLAKPISAKILFDRIYDVVNTPRVFVRASSYLGPDRRRFRSTTYDGPERRDGDPAKDADRRHEEPERQVASA